MKKTGIFYGSTTGTTADVAHRIGKLLGVADADIYDVADTKLDKLGDYDMLVLGSSTWGDGELQDDWYDFIDGAASLDLSGKTAAIFGCGDETMSDTFCNAIGIIYEKMRGTGLDLVGKFPASCYAFDSSKALTGDTMLGLALDEVNHPDLTDGRIAEWTDILKKS